MNFTCEPINDLVALPRLDHWQATGSDAQFMLAPIPNMTLLTPGWYLITASMKTGNGVLVDPCLYLDVGSGFAEASKIDLFFGCDQDWTTGQVVLLTTQVTRLRLDPSTQQCCFTFSDVKFKKLSRLSAGLKMAGTVFGRAFGKREKLKLLGNMATELLGLNLRKLGEWLRLKYNSRRDLAYSRWIELYENPEAIEKQWRLALLDKTGSKPKISILMPVYNTPEKWLRRCIESVIAQSYDNWELCIADDASTLYDVRDVLEEFAKRDNRIKIEFRKKNGHISAASNTALSLAMGSYVALLDHDDELAINALHEIALAINKHPEWKLIYSDEDKIDENGQRFNPYFKPEWNYDLLLSQNCISHLGVFDTQLVRDAGGFRIGFEGSQDYDLTLRLIENLKPSEIGHIPKILYHWRAIHGSTALGFQQKSYAQLAAQRAVREHLERRKIKADVLTTELGFQKIQYRQQHPVAMVTLIIPTKDRADLLRMSVGSILEKTNYPSFEIIIVNNQSVEDATARYFRGIVHDKRVRVLDYDAEFNFSAINNFAAQHATGTVLGLVNNDIEVIDGEWLAEMTSHAVRPDVGAVGAKLFYPDGTVQHAGVIVGLGGVAGHAYLGESTEYAGQASRACLTQNLSAVTAACLVVKKSVFDEVGGLDESLKVAFNDVDFCLRILQAGYRNVWTPFAQLYHHESQSRGYEDTPEKRARFQSEVLFMKNRWIDELDHDRAYNPNLTLNGNAFDLAYPPRV